MSTGSVSTDDKNEINKILGQQSSALIFSVARLYQCSPVGGDWRYHNIWGIIVLVIDRSIPGKPYFIRIFDVYTKELLFSEELYIEMEYKRLKPYFHVFSNRTAIVGLSFVKNKVRGHNEADMFYERVIKSIPREELAKEIMEGMEVLRKQSDSKGVMSRLARFFKSNKNNVKVSRPTGVVHKTHVSFDANQSKFFAKGDANEITEALRLPRDKEENDNAPINPFQAELGSTLKNKE